MTRLFLVIVLAEIFSLSAGYALATDEDSYEKTNQWQEGEQIYGSQLMTQHERDEFHAKMRTAKTAQEQEQIRKEHHERMQARAKAHGVSLPDETPAVGGSMGEHGSGGGHGGGSGGGHGGGSGGGHGGGSGGGHGGGSGGGHGG